jgi:hypothetical protein
MESLRDSREEEEEEEEDEDEDVEKEEEEEDGNDLSLLCPAESAILTVAVRHLFISLQ